MNNSKQIEALIEPAVAAVGLELLGCELIGGGKHTLIRVYIDSPQGVTIDDCERASRQISAMLDVEDPISGHYRLEVSSPGLDRPLFKLAHFTSVIGQRVKLKTSLPVGARRNFTGQLTAVDGEMIVLQLEDEKVTLDFSQIEKANLVPELN